VRQVSHRVRHAPAGAQRFSPSWCAKQSREQHSSFRSQRSPTCRLQDRVSPTRHAFVASQRATPSGLTLQIPLQHSPPCPQSSPIDRQPWGRRQRCVASGCSSQLPLQQSAASTQDSPATRQAGAPLPRQRPPSQRPEQQSLATLQGCSSRAQMAPCTQDDPASLVTHPSSQQSLAISQVRPIPWQPKVGRHSSPVSQLSVPSLEPPLALLAPPWLAPDEVPPAPLAPPKGGMGADALGDAESAVSSTCKRRVLQLPTATTGSSKTNTAPQNIRSIPRGRSC
jgi:hypothetical protein